MDERVIDYVVDRAADEFVVTVLALLQEAEGQQDEAAVRDTFQRSLYLCFWHKWLREGSSAAPTTGSSNSFDRCMSGGVVRGVGGVVVQAPSRHRM